MRVVIENACNACWKKDKTARQGVACLPLDGKEWWLCREHEVALAQQMIGLLGDPTGESEDA